MKLFEVQIYFKIITHSAGIRFKDKFPFYSTEKEFIKLEINNIYLSFSLQMHLKFFILTETVEITFLL